MPAAVNANTVDCAGSWSAWSTCSKECGGGTQTRTFIVTTQPANGGAACPTSPESRSCNTLACGSQCVLVKGTQYPDFLDGVYVLGQNWNSGFCGAGMYPAYYSVSKKSSLFFFATNCLNNSPTQGQWGLGDYAPSSSSYQWSGSVAYGTVATAATSGWSTAVTITATTCP